MEHLRGEPACVRVVAIPVQRPFEGPAGAGVAVSGLVSQGERLGPFLLGGLPEARGFLQARAALGRRRPAIEQRQRLLAESAGPLGQSTSLCERLPRGDELGGDEARVPEIRLQPICAIGGEDDEREDEHREPTPPALACHCAARSEEKGPLARPQGGHVERAHLVELPLSPEGLAGTQEALPLGTGHLDPLAQDAMADVVIQPVAERAPALDERLVGNLPARLSAHGARVQQPAVDERAKGGAGGPIRGLGELILAALDARALRRHEPKQESPRRHVLRRTQAREHPIRMPGQCSGHPAHRVERLAGDAALRRVAPLPQLRERELEQRQAAHAVGRGVDQRLEELTGLEDHAPAARGADDGLTHAFRRQGAEDVEPSLRFVA